MNRPLILDFDASVLPLRPDTAQGEGDIRLPLAAWQESVRFGCSWQTANALYAGVFGAPALNAQTPAMPEKHGCVFMGSGDYHHITLLLLRRYALLQNPAPVSVDVVVCDNHPDNMRYLFGLHCGSWVSHAAALPFVRHVHVLGICSEDITLKHAWENRLTPLLRGKLTYWSIRQKADWLTFFGKKEAARNFSGPDELMAAFLPQLAKAQHVYFSLDKDVFSEHVARTGWDQGAFDFCHIESLLAACAGKLTAMDVCGEASAYAYKSPLKKLLVRLDGLEPLSQQELPALHARHQALNSALLALFDANCS